MQELERYLASCASFDDWLSTRDRGGRGASRARSAAAPRARQRSYLPSGYSILSGAFADGSLASLHGGGVRLAVAARPSDGRYVVELVAYASIDILAEECLLAVEVETGASADRVEMVVQLYNWRTKSWHALESYSPREQRTVVATALQPADFVSPTGDVCLGLRAEHSRAFHTRTGLVRFTVED